MTKQVIHPETRIGHVHLKVSDLESSVKFYSEALGFEITSRIGNTAAFLSAGGYHHHIGLNTWESLGGKQPPKNSVGLYHFAILMPDRKELSRTVKRLLDYNWPIDGAADHGVSEAVYLSDPDGNGIEIYADRPKKEWKKDSKGIVMYTKPLDFGDLMKELK